LKETTWRFDHVVSFFVENHLFKREETTNQDFAIGKEAKM